MTEQEFLALPPEEQSALIGEKVLGECRHKWVKCGPNQWNHICEKCEETAGSVVAWGPKDFHKVGRSAPYAISSAASQTVLDALHLEWQWLLTNMTPDESWRMRLCHRRGGREVEGAAETDALTIGLTGLKAVGFIT